MELSRATDNLSSNLSNDDGYNLLSDFITCSLMCMCNSSDNRVCFQVFSKSCIVLNLDSQSEQKFKEAMANVKVVSTTKQQTNTTTPTSIDPLMYKFQRAIKLWESYFPSHRIHLDYAIRDVFSRVKKDGFISWPITAAPYIWIWMHTVAVQIDLDNGTNEKFGFLSFLPNIIECSICKNHYNLFRPDLLRTQTITSCSNTLLALHTHISRFKHMTQDVPSFIYNNSLVDRLYRDEYRRRYYILANGGN